MCTKIYKLKFLFYIFLCHVTNITNKLNTFYFQLGVKNIRRAAAPNDHPLFIDAIADIVSQHLRENKPVSPKFLLRCAHCSSSRCHESKQWFSSVCKTI